MRRPTAGRWTAILLALTLAGAACTFGTETTTAPTGDGGTDSPVTLRVWTHRNKSFNSVLESLGKAYTQQHPNVTVQLETFDYDSYVQTLQTALPAGTEADILQMFGTWACSYSGNLAPVPDTIATVAEAREVFFSAPIEGYVCDETLYGFPQEFNIEYGAILVNTALAEEAGVGTDGWASWDEFKADAKKLTVTQDGVITRAGYHFTSFDGLPYSFFSLILQNGGEFLNEDGTFAINTPEGKASLELMKSMVDEGIIDPTLFNDEANWVGDCYFEEFCAMGLVGPWVVPEYAPDFPDLAANTVYVPLPTLQNAEFVADSGWGLTVSNSSPAASTAWDFIAFATLELENAADFNVATGTLPALKANTEGGTRDRLVTAFPHFETWLPLLENARFVGSMRDRDLLFYDIAYPHILAALDGSETIDEALASMETEANESFG